MSLRELVFNSKTCKESFSTRSNRSSMNRMIHRQKSGNVSRNSPHSCSVDSCQCELFCSSTYNQTIDRPTCVLRTTSMLSSIMMLSSSSVIRIIHFHHSKANMAETRTIFYDVSYFFTFYFLLHTVIHPVRRA